MAKLDRFTAEDARRIGTTIGIDWRTAAFDMEQFRIGLHVELEHGSRDATTDVTHDYLTTPQDERTYYGSAASEAHLPVTFQCPDSSYTQEWDKTGSSWFSTGGAQPVGEDGGRLVGEFDNTLGGSGEHYTWGFSAAP